MSGFGLIFVDGKIIVSNGGEAAAALIERMSGSLASGEAKAIVVRATKGVSFEYLFEEQPCLVAHALN